VPIPFRLGAPCCGAMVPRGPSGQPKQCPRAVRRCGLVLRRREGLRPAEAWLAFACDKHAEGLVAPRALLDRDRAVLEAWRAEARRKYSTERPWRAPQPLARGVDAVKLVERARRWAERRRATGAS
jgi:hypothetical protein